MDPPSMRMTAATSASLPMVVKWSTDGLVVSVLATTATTTAQVVRIVATIGGAEVARFMALKGS